MNVEILSGTSLAYIGDAVLSLMVRKHLVEKGYHPRQLTKRSIVYVSANAHLKIVRELIAIDFFSESELRIIYRGRNGKGGSVPKNSSVEAYRMSTGFEALLGYLYLENNETRLNQIWEKVKTLVEG